MKPFEAQSYYELLEVSVSATRAEIEAAFGRLSRLYGDDQMSLYGLVEPQRARELMSRLDEALQVLTNDELRAEYDKRIGLPPRELPRPVEPAPASPVALPAELKPAEADPASTAGRVALSWVPAPLPSAPPAPALLETTGAATTSVGPGFAATRSISGEVPAGSDGPSRSDPPRADDARPSSSPPALSRAPPSMSGASATRGAAGETGTARPPASDAPELAQEMALLEPRPQKVPAPPPAQGQEPTAPAVDPRRLPFEVPEGAVFDGALLKRVREARGLSLQTVSDRTRIGLRHLENVEADRYGTLPAAVYLRGMLMSLSRELGIDGLKVSRSYLALVEQAKDQAKG